MKTLFVLLILVLTADLSFGQVYFEEDFSSGDMPPEGWTIEGSESQWHNSNSSNAGGIAPEAWTSWQYSNSLSRVISPVIDLSGTSNVKINLKHFLDDYNGSGYSIGADIRSGGNDWETIWEVFPNSNIGPEVKFLDIPSEYQGVSDFQFCIFFDGNWENFDTWSIDDIKLLTTIVLDLELTSIQIPSFVEPNEVFDISGIVINNGSEPINTFDVTYTVDGQNPSVSTFDGLNIHIGETYYFVCNDELSFTESGNYSVEVVIDNINGGEDDNIENNDLFELTAVLPYLIDKKIIGEEATGAWCGWCVRGTCFMDYMAETYPDNWIGVAIHSSDPMEVEEYANEIPNLIPNFTGYPSGTVNRTNKYDPSGFEAAFLNSLQRFTPASLEISNYSWDENTREISFNLESEFIINYYNETRFMAIIIEDSVWGRGEDWAQSNYYSGGGSGPMCDFENLPNPVPDVDMHYDHVAKVVLDTPFGTIGSLPDTVFTGEVYTYAYTYTIPEDWDFHKLTFIGVILDIKSGEIINANSITGDLVGTTEHTLTDNINIYPNPTKGIVNVSGTENATIIIYNTQGVTVESYQNFNNNTIDITKYPKGIYLFWIKTNYGVITKRVVLD